MNPRFEETPVGRHQNVWPETKKGAPHLTSSHNNKTDLASTLPLDNNVTRKNGVLREAPLTEAGGSWKVETYLVKYSKETISVLFDHQVPFNIFGCCERA